MIYNKPFKTYSQQLDKLINDYNLIVKNRDSAIESLKFQSYYDLANGYKTHLMINDKFKTSIDFDFLSSYAMFDKSIQSILLKYSISVETKFKNLLAYILGQEFGVDVDQYLDIEKYKKISNKEKMKQRIKKIDEIKGQIHSCHYNPTKHYLDNCNHIPPWIAFKNISFSSATDIFKYLEDDIKDKVCDALINKNIPNDKKREFVTNSLYIIRTYRNSIAHNLNFVTYSAMNQFRLKKDAIKGLSDEIFIDSKIVRKNNGTIDIYSMFISLVILLDNKQLNLNFAADIKNAESYSKYHYNSEDVLIEYYNNCMLPTLIYEKIMLYIKEQLN